MAGVYPRMKTIRFSLVTLAAIALLAPVAMAAEDQGGEGRKNGKHFGGPGGPGGGGFFAAGLNDEERQKLMAAREKAFADNPSLKTEGEELRGMREKVQSGAMTKEDAFAKMKAFGEKVDAALVKADPSIAPILEKRNAAMKERWAGKKGPGPGGAPGGGGAGGAFSDTPKAPGGEKKADQ